MKCTCGCGGSVSPRKGGLGYCRGHNPRSKGNLLMTAYDRVKWTRAWFEALGHGRRQDNDDYAASYKDVAKEMGMLIGQVEYIECVATNKYILRHVGLIIEEVEAVNGSCSMMDIADALRIGEDHLPMWRN